MKANNVIIAMVFMADDLIIFSHCSSFFFFMIRSIIPGTGIYTAIPVSCSSRW